MQISASARHVSLLVVLMQILVVQLFNCKSQLCKYQLSEEGIIVGCVNANISSANIS